MNISESNYKVIRILSINTSVNLYCYHAYFLERDDPEIIYSLYLYTTEPQTIDVNDNIEKTLTNLNQTADHNETVVHCIMLMRYVLCIIFFMFIIAMVV